MYRGFDPIHEISGRVRRRQLAWIDDDFMVAAGDAGRGARDLVLVSELTPDGDQATGVVFECGDGTFERAGPSYSVEIRLRDDRLLIGVAVRHPGYVVPRGVKLSSS